MAELEFPDGFVWGTATASHQVEGGNWNSDWWMWEHDPASPCVEPSGDACDHAHRYPDDLTMLADLGFGAYRFSVEWARVEPEDGEFSRAQLEHYRRMVGACRERDLLPVVTLHHFTLPRWVAAGGGWEAPVTVDRFARYCERVVGHLGDAVATVCTINEPNIVSLMGYGFGIFPPGVRDPDARLRVNDALVAAHRRAVEAVKAGPGDAPVGLTLSMADWQAVGHGEDGQGAAEARLAELREPMEDVFLDATRGDDFIGVQTYSRVRVGPEGMLGPEAGVPTTQMGYELWPEALGPTVRRAAEVTGSPVVVTENGIGTDDDALRIAYLDRALRSLHRCVADGVDVRGYFCWSFLDNFEWVLGYGPTFGIVAVDRQTQARTPKPSAAWLGDVARANRLPGPLPQG